MMWAALRPELRTTISLWLNLVQHLAKMAEEMEQYDVKREDMRIEMPQFGINLIAKSIETDTTVKVSNHVDLRYCGIKIQPSHQTAIAVLFHIDYPLFQYVWMKYEFPLNEISRL